MSEMIATETAKDVEVVATDVRALIANLANGTPSMVSTLPVDTFESKRVAYGLMTQSESLEDQGMLGKPFNLTHIIAHPVTITTKEGERVEAPRVVLVDDAGNGYAAVSSGIFKAVEDIVAFFGMPEEWENGILPVEVVQRKTRKGFRFFTINVL